jgi:hypothetical protein
MLVNGAGVTTSAVLPGVIRTADAITATSGADWLLAGGGATVGAITGAAIRTGARTAILRVGDRLSCRRPRTRTARTVRVSAVSLVGALNSNLNLRRARRDRPSVAHLPALRRCSTTRASRGARRAVPTAVRGVPLAADAGTESDSAGDDEVRAGAADGAAARAATRTASARRT